MRLTVPVGAQQAPERALLQRSALCGAGRPPASSGVFERVQHRWWDSCDRLLELL